MPFTGTEFLPTQNSITLGGDSNAHINSIGCSLSPNTPIDYGDISAQNTYFSTVKRDYNNPHFSTPPPPVMYGHISMSPSNMNNAYNERVTPLPIVPMNNHVNIIANESTGPPMRYNDMEFGQIPQRGNETRNVVAFDDQTKVVKCPYCANVHETHIVREIGTTNILASALACICLPCSWLGCQCIPLCVEDWKDAVHYCGVCGRKLGSYNSLANIPSA